MLVGRFRPQGRKIVSLVQNRGGIKDQPARPGANCRSSCANRSQRGVGYPARTAIVRVHCSSQSFEASGFEVCRFNTVPSAEVGASAIGTVLSDAPCPLSAETGQPSAKSRRFGP